MKLKIRKTLRRKRRNIRYKTKKSQKGSAQALQVFYDNQQVLGQELLKSQTQSQPSVKFPITDKLYTLIMWDPDVPPQIQPGFVHWIATNLKNPNDINNNQVLEYKGPNPPSGIHRYYFELFEQQGYIRPQQPERPNFNINEFIKKNNLSRVSNVFMKASTNYR